MILTLLKQIEKNFDGKCFEDDINNMKNSHKGIKSIISLRKRQMIHQKQLAPETMLLLIREQL